MVFTAIGKKATPLLHHHTHTLTEWCPKYIKRECLTNDIVKIK